MAEQKLLGRLPDLLAYPSEEFPRLFDDALEALESHGGDCAEKLAPLARLLGSERVEALQELYTRTFDISPACTLEIGWHLYGEDYRRGAFLVRVRGLMRATNVAETGELPDHVVHVLPVLAGLSPLKAEPFARGHVIPAIEKMLAGFADRENPYYAVVELIRDLLVETFGPGDEVAGNAPASADPYEAAAPVCGPGAFTFEQEP